MALAEFRAGVPQGEPFAMVPPVESVQGVGRHGFPMLPALASWCAKDTLGEHEELAPSFVVVVVHRKRALVKAWLQA